MNRNELYLLDKNNPGGGAIVLKLDKLCSGQLRSDLSNTRETSSSNKLQQRLLTEYNKKHVE
jgi:hypothetical protein